MLSHVTFTGWDRHTDLAELANFLENCPQGRVEIAVLYSATRSAANEDRYPNVGKAAEILRTAKAAGQRTALHLCGSAARELLASASDLPYTHALLPFGLGHVLNLADRVQINVDAGFWTKVGGVADYRQAYTTSRSLGRPVILQTRDLSAWPDVEHFAAGASRMMPFLFDRSAGAGVEMTGWPDPPPGRLVGYAGGLGPDNAAELLSRLAAHPGSRVWIDMETRIRERPSNVEASYVSITKCRRVMNSLIVYFEGYEP